MSDYMPINNQNTQLLESDSIETLPVYCSGAYVSPGTPEAMNTSMLQIQIKNTQKSYDIHDIITGEIKFSPKAPANVLSIIAVLESQEVISRSTWMRSKQKNSITTLQSQIIPLSLLSSEPEFVPGFVYTFPFLLQVPEYRPQSTAQKCADDIQEHTRLAPSLGAPPGTYPLSESIENNLAYITYSVKGLVKVKKNSKNVTLCQGCQIVNIQPSYTLSPLAQYKVKQHPYSCAYNYSSKRSLVKSHQKGQITLKLSKHPAVAMNKATNMMLSLTTAQCTFVQVSDIRMDLIATTSFFDECKINTFELASFKPWGTSWLLNSDQSGNSVIPSHNVSLYTAKFSIPFMLPENRLVTPTFESCLMSRCYSLIVTVTTADRAKYSLTVPVNVVALLNTKSNYPFEPVYFSDASSISEGDSDKLPQYDPEDSYRGPPGRSTGTSSETCEEHVNSFVLNSYTLKSNVVVFS
jgi:hypothetical protein